MRNGGVQVSFLILAAVCLVSVQTAGQQTAGQARTDAPADALAMQISSELRSAVEVSNIGNVGSNPMWKAAGLTYDVHMSDCENRWVALYHKPEDPNYTYGFVYIDPQAGFTLHFFGRFTVDMDGNYHAAPKLVFELVYAYNALERPEDAIRVSKSEFAKNPKDELLCREMAFAYLHLKSYKEAATQYQACIALCGDSESQMAEKSELAMNLSSTYKALADTPNSEAWLEKAKHWAPKGSPVYRYFHPGEE